MEEVSSRRRNPKHTTSVMDYVYSWLECGLSSLSVLIYVWSFYFPCLMTYDAQCVFKNGYSDRKRIPTDSINPLHLAQSLLDQLHEDLLKQFYGTIATMILLIFACILVVSLVMIRTSSGNSQWNKHALKIECLYVFISFGAIGSFIFQIYLLISSNSYMANHSKNIIYFETPPCLILISSLCCLLIISAMASVRIVRMISLKKHEDGNEEATRSRRLRHSRVASLLSVSTLDSYYIVQSPPPPVSNPKCAPLLVRHIKLPSAPLDGLVGPYLNLQDALAFYAAIRSSPVDKSNDRKSSFSNSDDCLPYIIIKAFIWDLKIRLFTMGVQSESYVVKQRFISGSHFEEDLLSSPKAALSLYIPHSPQFLNVTPFMSKWTSERHALSASSLLLQRPIPLDCIDWVSLLAVAIDKGWCQVAACVCDCPSLHAFLTENGLQIPKENNSKLAVVSNSIEPQNEGHEHLSIQSVSTGQESELELGHLLESDTLGMVTNFEAELLAEDSNENASTNSNTSSNGNVINNLNSYVRPRLLSRCFISHSVLFATIDKFQLSPSVILKIAASLKPMDVCPESVLWLLSESGLEFHINSLEPLSKAIFNRNLQPDDKKNFGPIQCIQNLLLAFRLGHPATSDNLFLKFLRFKVGPIIQVLQKHEEYKHHQFLASLNTPLLRTSSNSSAQLHSFQSNALPPPRDMFSSFFIHIVRDSVSRLDWRNLPLDDLDSIAKCVELLVSTGRVLGKPLTLRVSLLFNFVCPRANERFLLQQIGLHASRGDIKLLGIALSTTGDECLDEGSFRDRRMRCNLQGPFDDRKHCQLFHGFVYSRSSDFREMEEGGLVLVDENALDVNDLVENEKDLSLNAAQGMVRLTPSSIPVPWMDFFSVYRHSDQDSGNGNSINDDDDDGDENNDDKEEDISYFNNNLDKNHSDNHHYLSSGDNVDKNTSISNSKPLGPSSHNIHSQQEGVYIERFIESLLISLPVNSNLDQCTEHQIPLKPTSQLLNVSHSYFHHQHNTLHASKEDFNFFKPYGLKFPESLEEYLSVAQTWEPVDRKRRTLAMIHVIRALSRHGTPSDWYKFGLKSLSVARACGSVEAAALGGEWDWQQTMELWHLVDKNANEVSLLNKCKKIFLSKEGKMIETSLFVKKQHKVAFSNLS